MGEVKSEGFGADLNLIHVPIVFIYNLIIMRLMNTMCILGLLISMTLNSQLEKEGEKNEILKDLE